MKSILALWVLAISIIGGPLAFAAAEMQTVAGAGPSTAVVQLFFDHFGNQPEAKGYLFVVPERSAKHAGGIKCSDDNLFGRTGRPLSPKEKKMNKAELVLAKVPIAFAVGSGAGVSELDLGELKAVYLREVTNWRELGGADAEIVLAGREESEALFTTLRDVYPYFKRAEFDQIFKKDHQVVNFLKSPQGKYAVGFGAGPNFGGLNVLKVKGFEAGVNVGLVYDLKNQGNPLVGAVEEYAGSSEWKGCVLQLGLLPVAKN